MGNPSEKSPLLSTVAKKWVIIKMCPSAIEGLEILILAFMRKIPAGHLTVILQI